MAQSNPQTTALAKTQPPQGEHLYRDPRAVSDTLRRNEQAAHLVSPATSVQAIPEGCGVAITTIHVNGDKEAGEVYDVGSGKFGLAKAALDRISIAAGISWDARQSRRLDDGSDPHYAMFLAVGHLRTFDGQRIEIMGTKEMDLRNGSPQCVAIQERARDGKSRDRQIREMRLHILGHAESKARLRAIRSIGIKSSYTAKELEKPFVVARLMWTGHSTDPELKRAFALKQADAMLGGVSALYGHEAAAAASQPALMAPAIRPPRVGSVAADDDDYGAPPAPAPASAPASRAVPQTQGSGAVWPWDAKKEGDPAKGTPLTQVDDGALERLATYCEKKAGEGGRFAERDRDLAGAARAELAARQKNDDEPPADDGQDEYGGRIP